MSSSTVTISHPDLKNWLPKTPPCYSAQEQVELGRRHAEAIETEAVICVEIHTRPGIRIGHGRGIRRTDVLELSRTTDEIGDVFQVFDRDDDSSVFYYAGGLAGSSLVVSTLTDIVSRLYLISSYQFDITLEIEAVYPEENRFLLFCWFRHQDDEQPDTRIDMETASVAQDLVSEMLRILGPNGLKSSTRVGVLPKHGADPDINDLHIVRALLAITASDTATDFMLPMWMMRSLARSGEVNLLEGRRIYYIKHWVGDEELHDTGNCVDFLDDEDATIPNGVFLHGERNEESACDRTRAWLDGLSSAHSQRYHTVSEVWQFSVIYLRDAASLESLNWAPFFGAFRNLRRLELEDVNEYEVEQVGDTVKVLYDTDRLRLEYLSLTGIEWYPLKAILQLFGCVYHVSLPDYKWHRMDAEVEWNQKSGSLRVGYENHISHHVVCPNPQDWVNAVVRGACLKFATRVCHVTLSRYAPTRLATAFYNSVRRNGKHKALWMNTAMLVATYRTQNALKPSVLALMPTIQLLVGESFRYTSAWDQTEMDLIDLEFFKAVTAPAVIEPASSSSSSSSCSTEAPSSRKRKL